MNISQMHFYSRGKVAANKVLGSFDIEVWAYEINPMADGEVTDDIQEIEAKGVDSDGKAFSTRVDTTVSISATWLPFGQDNRITAPDVRRGEEVMIWQFANNSKKFYWTSAERGIALRRLETYIFAISGSPKEDEEPNATNTYFMEMSSHKGNITFHTSTANGEPFEWDFQINAGGGNSTWRSSAGESISMDSKESIIEIINAMGSVFVADKKKIKIYAEEEIDIQSDKIKINGKSLISTETKEMTTKASTWAIDSTTTHKGALTEVGPFSLQGNMTSTGGEGGGDGTIEIGGNVVISKTVEAKNGATFGGTVEANKVVSKENISAPNV